MSKVPNMLTVGELARNLDEPIHRIDYVLRTRNIKPSGRAGSAYVYTDSDRQYIASELRRIDEEKGVSHETPRS